MISTHILDTTKGNPASGVKVTLQKKEKGAWHDLATAMTNNDGRIAFQNKAEIGDYRLVFHIEEYCQAQYPNSFFTEAPVSFRIQDANRKYHVPLLLNPFGYSTYRGS